MEVGYNASFSANYYSRQNNSSYFNNSNSFSGFNNFNIQQPIYPIAAGPFTNNLYNNTNQYINCNYNLASLQPQFQAAAGFNNMPLIAGPFGGKPLFMTSWDYYESSTPSTRDGSVSDDFSLTSIKRGICQERNHHAVALSIPELTLNLQESKLYAELVK